MARPARSYLAGRPRNGRRLDRSVDDRNVRPATAVDHILSSVPCLDPVGAGAGAVPIFAAAADQNVGAGRASEPVVAALPEQEIRARGAGQPVVFVRALERESDTVRRLRDGSSGAPGPLVAVTTTRTALERGRAQEERATRAFRRCYDNAYRRRAPSAPCMCRSRARPGSDVRGQVRPTCGRPWICGGATRIGGTGGPPRSVRRRLIAGQASCLP